MSFCDLEVDTEVGEEMGGGTKLPDFPQKRLGVLLINWESP